MKLRSFLLYGAAAITSVAMLSISSAYGAILYSQNFETLADGTALTTANSGFSAVTTTASFSTAIARADTGLKFGAGASNKYLEIVDSSDSGTASPNNNKLTTLRKTLTTVPVGGVAQLSVDFYDPADATTDLLNLTFDNGGNPGRSMHLVFANGTLGILSADQASFSYFGSYTENAKHNLVVVFNVATSSIVYGSGAALAGQSFDVYLDNSLVANDMPFSNSTASPVVISRFNVFTGTSTTAAGNLDNIVIENAITTALPEPSTFGLIGLGLVGLAFLRKQRQK